MEKKLVFLLCALMGYITVRLLMLSIQYSRIDGILMAIVGLIAWFIFITVYFFNPKND